MLNALIRLPAATRSWRQAAAAAARSSIALALACTGVLAANASALGQAVVVPIPPLAGDDFVDGNALSSDGLTVVGSSGLNGENLQRAMVWRSATGSVLLPGPAGGPVRNGDYPTGCSADGSVIVGVTGFNYPNGPYYVLANQWTNGILSVLPDLSPMTYPRSTARSVSENGQVVLGGSLPLSNSIRAVRWVGNGPAQDLGMPAGFTLISANGLTADGSVIVGVARVSEYADQGTHGAFRWTLANGWQPLPPLPGFTGAGCGAITPDGSFIVGGSFNSVSNPSPVRATRWNNGIPEDLGTLPGATGSGAGIISHDGQMVIGTSGNAPFVWTPSTGMLDLLEVLAGQGVDLSAYQASPIFVEGLSADKHTLLMTAFNNTGGIDSWLVQNFAPPCLPSITTHPAAAVACPGQPVNLSFSATGTGAVSASWKVKIGQQYEPIVDGVNTYPQTGLSFTASGAATTSLSLSSITLGSDPNPLLLRGRATDSCGGVNTIPAQVIVASASITQQPVNREICPTDSTSYTFATTSNISSQRQWQIEDQSAPGGWRDLADGQDPSGANVSGALAATLHLSPITAFTPASVSTFRCVVTTACGSQLSTPATLTILSTSAQITQNPAPVALPPEGGPAVLHIAATGGPSLTYRWECRYPQGEGPWLPFGDGDFFSPQENFWFNAQGSAGDTLTIIPNFDGIPAEQWRIEFRCIPRATCDGVPSLPALVSILQPCGIADVAGFGGSPGWDGQLTVDDLVYYLAQFFANNAAVADIVGPGGDPGPDTQVTVDDLVAFLSAFFSPCP